MKRLSLVLLRRILRLTVLLMLASPTFAQTVTTEAGAQVEGAPEVDGEDSDEKNKDEEKLPPGRTEYMGREIAATMHYAGASWLIRSSRERQEGCSIMLKNLGVKPGMTVCDLGCGNGFYSIQLAKMVGESGKVLAVDIQPEMLTLLKARAKQAEIGNIKPILGTLADPRLPKAAVDIVLCADVYHEFSHPEYMLAAIHKSLKPTGRVVLLEFRSEDPDVPIKRLHKMSKAQVNKELTANKYRLYREFDDLPWQHMMFFGRTDGVALPGDKKQP